MRLYKSTELKILQIRICALNYSHLHNGYVHKDTLPPRHCSLTNFISVADLYNIIYLDFIAVLFRREGCFSFAAL